MRILSSKIQDRLWVLLEAKILQELQQLHGGRPVRFLHGQATPDDLLEVVVDRMPFGLLQLHRLRHRCSKGGEVGKISKAPRQFAHGHEMKRQPQAPNVRFPELFGTTTIVDRMMCLFKGEGIKTEPFNALGKRVARRAIRCSGPLARNNPWCPSWSRPSHAAADKLCWSLPATSHSSLKNRAIFFKKLGNQKIKLRSLRSMIS